MCCGFSSCELDVVRDVEEDSGVLELSWTTVAVDVANLASAGAM